MSALPPKADIIPHCIKCPLIANSGHWLFLNNNRNVVYLDAGGESRPPNQDLSYDPSRLSVVAYLALPEVVLLKKRGDAFEHIPRDCQLDPIVISSQVFD